MIINRRYAGENLKTATLTLTNPSGKIWFYDAEGQFHEETASQIFTLPVPCLISSEETEFASGSYEGVVLGTGTCVYKMLGDMTITGWI